MVSGKQLLLLWPPAASVHGPPLGLSAIAGFLRARRPGDRIQAADLNVECLREAVERLPPTSGLGRMLRSRWTQADIVQDALSRWAFGDDAPGHVGALPDWECHYLALLFAQVLDGFVDGLTAVPDLVGISVCDNGLIAAIGLTRRLRARFPRTLLVWGGVSMNPQQARAALDIFPEVDAVVSGDGEEPLVALAETAPDLPAAAFPGVHTRAQPGVIEAVRNHYLTEEPAFDLFDLGAYPALELPISIGRGCAWGRCSFCNENFATTAYQGKDPDEAATRALALQARYQPVSFNLVDSAANSNRTAFRTFVDRLRAGGGLREWRCMMRTAGVTQESLARATESGLRTVYFGLESLDDTVLTAMEKGETLAQHLHAIRLALEAGLRVEGDLILFYPADTPEAVERATEIVRRYDHLFSRIDLSFSRFVPGLRSETWLHPENHGIRLLDASLRLARHLPPSVGQGLVAWDPLWTFDGRPVDEVKALADRYLRLQEVVAEVRGGPPTSRVVYCSGGATVLETHGKDGAALDRVFLNEIQTEIWNAACHRGENPDHLGQRLDVPASAMEELLEDLRARGFVYRDAARYSSVAFEHGMPLLRRYATEADRGGGEPQQVTPWTLRRTRVD